MNKILLFRDQFLQKFKDFFRSTVFDEEGVLESPNYLNHFLKKIQNASILMIPTAFNSGKLFVQEPTNRNEDFSVIRNSTVRRMNQDGNWEEVPINTPCIDYSTGEPLLLTQPQSTNLITYSEDFSNSSWVKQSGTVPTYNTTDTLSPDGTYNATKIIGNGVTGIFNSGASVTGIVSRSIYLKSVTGTVNVTFRDPNLTVTIKTLTLTTEWQRFELNEDNGFTTQGLWVNGIPTSGIYIWGAQLEEQPFATSYIPTNGSVSSRLKDEILNAGSTDTINSEEGVLYFEGSALTDVDGVIDRTISLSDGASTINEIFLRYSSVSNEIKCTYKKNNLNRTVILSNVNVLDINFFALVWDDEKLRVYMNESFVSEVTVTDTFSANILNNLKFSRGNNAQPFYGKTKELRVYKTQEDANKDLPYIIPFDSNFLQSYKDFINDIRNIGGVTEKKTYTDNLLKEAVNASIVNVPTSYGVGKLFNQSPNDRNEDFDVIRNSAVFRTAPNGLLEEIGVNVPCIDYTTGNPLLLTQPQSTNKLTYSEDFSQFNIGGDTTREGGFADPKGGNNAYKFTGTSGAVTSIGVVLLSTEARSIWARTVSGSGTIQLCSQKSNTNNLFTVTEEWQRFEVIGTTSTAGDTIFYPVDFRGVGNLNEIILFGAQAEEQDFVTSYIPTNGSVATRLQDTIVNSGSTDTIGSEEGVLYMECAALVEGGSNRSITISDETSSNYVLFKYDATDNQVRFIYRINNVNEAAIVKNSVNVLDINSFALSWDNQNVYTYVNEVLNESRPISNTFSANTLNTIGFEVGGGGGRFFGKTKELRVYKSIAEAQIDLPYIT